MSKQPLSPVGDGRDRKGRFAPGNKLATGNPHARQVGALRSALLNTVKPADIREVVQKLVELAKAGDLVAARLLLERCLGPAVPIDVMEQIEQMQEQLERLTGGE
jgi:hypothetical protein